MGSPSLLVQKFEIVFLDALGQTGRVASQQVDMFEAQGRELSNVGGLENASIGRYDEHLYV
jgi:hypothetical protein